MAFKIATSQDLALILANLKSIGYCVVEMQDDISNAELAAFARQFGDVLGHPDADQYGCVPVAERNGSDVPLHSDGSFLNGVICVDGQFYNLTPPAFKFLHYPANQKGPVVFYMVDGGKIYDRLKDHPVMASLCYESAFVCVGTEAGQTQSLFRKTHTGRLRINLPSPKRRYTLRPIVDLWQRFECELLENLQLGTAFKLQPSHLLVVDNWRMLHGRPGRLQLNKDQEQMVFFRLWVSLFTDETRIAIPRGLPAISRAWLKETWSAYLPRAELQWQASLGHAWGIDRV